MYYISSFIARIGYGFSRATSFITTPFRSATYGLKSLTRFNPFTAIRNQLYPVETQVRQVLGLKPKAPTAKKPGQSAENRREVRQGRWRSRSHARVAQRAQYSQIHLINQADEERTVVHIGTIIGRSSSDLVLEFPEQNPVQLRFSQVDPQEHKAPMMLTYVAGTATLTVNGVEVEHETPLSDNAVISVNKQTYVCQLYAWDKAPVITRVDAGWGTDVGPTREENQDAIGIYQTSDAYLFAIADGVGQGEYGGLVSEFAIRYLLAVFDKNMKYRLSWDDILSKAYKYINAEVRHFARYSPSSEGTTLTAVVIKGMEAHIAHVGDSRLYLWHEGSLEQLTTDHVGQQTVEQETRVANEALETPQTRTVLAKAIGKADTIKPDIFTIMLQPGDRLLLTTDGVTGVIPDDEMVKLFPTLRAGWLAGKLIQMAVERGTKDNVSAITVDVLKDAYVEDAWLAENEPRISAGYNRSWAMRMERPRDLYTHYPVTSRRGFRLALAIIAVLIVAFILIRSSGNGNVNAQIPAATGETTALSVSTTEEATATETPTGATEAASPTAATPTEPATATLPPTVTRVRPTATPTLPPTAIPPTSTLRSAAFGASLSEAQV